MIFRLFIGALAIAFTVYVGVAIKADIESVGVWLHHETALNLR
jgi:hypothetical protein